MPNKIASDATTSNISYKVKPRFMLLGIKSAYQAIYRKDNGHSNGKDTQPHHYKHYGLQDDGNIFYGIVALRAIYLSQPAECARQSARLFGRGYHLYRCGRKEAAQAAISLKACRKCVALFDTLG